MDKRIPYCPLYNQFSYTALVNNKYRYNLKVNQRLLDATLITIGIRVQVTGVCNIILPPVLFDKRTKMFSKIRSFKIIATIRRTADRNEM